MSTNRIFTIIVIAVALAMQMSAQPAPIQIKPTGKPFSPAEIKKLWQQANDLAKRPQFLSAFAEAASNPKVAAEAQRSPAEYLRKRGIVLPNTLSVNFLDSNELATMEATPGKPAPDDFYFFTIRLVDCRTFWVWNPPNKPERITVCMGFEIIPNYLPPIARTLGRLTRSSG